MLLPEEFPRRSDATARLQHQAFFEVLQHGEGTRDWIAARAGLIVLRYVLARSESDGEPGALAAEEGKVAAAVDALPAGDAERAALHAVLNAMAVAIQTSTPDLAQPDAKRNPRTLEPVADALIRYGDALASRSAWPLAAEVYATVWDTRAAPNARFGEGIDPRDVEESLAESGGPGPAGLNRQIAPATAWAALKLAICYRTLGRRDDAQVALEAARAAALQCRDDAIGQYISFRSRLGATLMLLDAGRTAEAEPELAALVAESASNPQLRDGHARAKHAQAVAAYRRQRGPR
jgi:tetratricopeptide (TPR) repeat protein